VVPSIVAERSPGKRKSGKRKKGGKERRSAQKKVIVRTVRGEEEGKWVLVSRGGERCASFNLPRKSSIERRYYKGGKGGKSHGSKEKNEPRPGSGAVN